MAGHCFLYLDGLRALAADLAGSETMHVGIRPFGFHCGNALSLVAYPYLLCEELERLGKVPRFRLVVSINDWEQYRAAGPCPARYPYNILPESRTIQYTPVPERPGWRMTEVWQPVIEAGFAPIRERFRQVEMAFVRNSDLKLSPEFRRLVLRTLHLGPEIGTMLDRHTRFPVLSSPPPRYVGAVCPRCSDATGPTTVTDDGVVRLSCRGCGACTGAPYEGFDYWWHHKPMFIARWEHFGFDVAVSGADHYEDGDVAVRHRMRQLFGLRPRRLRMLFSPKVLDDDGHKMGKTLGNEQAVEPGELIDFARGFPGTEFRIGAVAGP